MNNRESTTEQELRKVFATVALDATKREGLIQYFYTLYSVHPEEFKNKSKNMENIPGIKNMTIEQLQTTIAALNKLENYEIIGNRDQRIDNTEIHTRNFQCIFMLQGILNKKLQIEMEQELNRVEQRFNDLEKNLARSKQSTQGIRKQIVTTLQTDFKEFKKGALTQYKNINDLRKGIKDKFEPSITKLADAEKKYQQTQILGFFRRKNEKEIRKVLEPETRRPSKK